MTPRFSLGWYVSRGLAVIFSAVVLITLLSEAMRLHAALSRSYLSLERERTNRLMSVRAATSSIAHEARQPLTAIIANAQAARTWLGKAQPDVRTVQTLLDEIERAGLRAEEVLGSVPRLFADSDGEHEPIDVNRLALESLQILSGELDSHRIRTDVELALDLPFVVGNRIQLQEVVLNLIRNAIEAMAPTAVDGRSLKLRTRHNRAEALVIEVEDSGPGIEVGHLSKIFDAFVTTKPGGTGLGLAICSRIVQLHGGQLTASSDGKNGALFHLVLPIPPKTATEREMHG